MTDAVASEKEQRLCLARSKSRWNFMRTWYCSEPEGHGPDVPHQARSEHTSDGEVVWFGPWEDGSFFEAPEWAGIEPWAAALDKTEADHG